MLRAWIPPASPLPEFRSISAEHVWVERLQLPRVPYEISLALIFEIGNDLNIYCPVNADTVRNYLSVVRPPPLSCVCAHLEANKRGFPFGPVKEPAEALFHCLLSDNCNQDCLVLNLPPRFQLPRLAALSARCSLFLPSPSGDVHGAC